MLATVLEKETLVKNNIQEFYSEIDFINQKLEESEKSPVQSIESAYLEWWN